MRVGGGSNCASSRRTGVGSGSKPSDAGSDGLDGVFAAGTGGGTLDGDFRRGVGGIRLGCLATGPLVPAGAGAGAIGGGPGGADGSVQSRSVLSSSPPALRRSGVPTGGGTDGGLGRR